MFTTRIQGTGERRGVHAARDVAPGEVLLSLRGVAIDAPYRYSLQITADLHLAPLVEFDGDSTWCFVNHACDPNCRVDLHQMALVALRFILTGEELSFNYCSTEYDLADPFGCLCGAAGCYRRIQGFRYLSGDQKRQLSAVLAPHLLALIAADV